MAWAEVYLSTKWHLDLSSRLATTDMSRKVGVAVPLLGAAGSPSNTMWPGPWPTSVPSGTRHKMVILETLFIANLTLRTSAQQ